jgi:hypothetical protein
MAVLGHLVITITMVGQAVAVERYQSKEAYLLVQVRVEQYLAQVVMAVTEQPQQQELHREVVAVQTLPGTGYQQVVRELEEKQEYTLLKEEFPLHRY